MTTQSRLVRGLACGAISLGLIAASPMLAGAALAQTTLVDPRAPKADAPAHDRALAAAAKGDYIGALELAKQAAAAGQPLDPDQLDYFSGKAAKQQAALEEQAKVKAAAEAAAGTAQQIAERQQKEYAARNRQVAEACGKDEPKRIGTFTSAAGAAGSSGSGAFGARVTGTDDPRKKC